MDSLLLATKLRIPPQPQHGVRRARLVDALERGLLHCKLVLLLAPAGYGKTTLLSQWAQASRFPVVWLTIGEEDNDLERFLRYLLVGWEEVQPGVRESPLGLLLGAMSPDREAVLRAFINVANEAPGPVVFVLDDYHLIDDSSIHQALAFLLDHLPPTVHFVLAGRAEPPLPLARYRARQELVEFRAQDLSFLPEETGDFLKNSMGLDLAGEDIARLQAQLEGWVAGLQLVALTLRQQLTGADKLVVSGRHRFIADYLQEDVLAPLADGVRQFLLRTSILDRLCGSLCDAVTGQADGQDLLETLERENLFLVPLDDSRTWFRYHGLFADFLHQELKRRHTAEVAELHRRAARWYLGQDLPEQAFRHSVEGQDIELVTQIMNDYLPRIVLRGDLKLLERWVKSIPLAWYADYPMLSIARAGSLLLTGEFDACARYLDEVEQRLAPARSEDTDWCQARVTAVRCFMACFHNDLPQAEVYGNQALRDLPETDLSFRADTYQALGDTYRAHGRWKEAREYYHKVLDLVNEPEFRVRSVHVFGALADLELRQGRLRNSAAYWRKALNIIQEPESWGSLPHPLIGWVYIRLGELLYEWNKLAEARDHLSRGLARAELGGDVRALIAGYLLSARFKLTEGDVERAAGYVERARPLVESAQFPDWTSRFERCQLELWLAQDRLRAAVNRADEVLRDAANEERPDREVAQLSMARILIVKGDGPSVERALALLEQLLGAAEGEGRTVIQIEALALLALAHSKLGQLAEAMTALERALRLAEPEGYVRLFADLGLPMARLLQAARSRKVMPDYVARLLAACGGDLGLPAPAEQALPEPLTPREQEILELLAAGMRNREIAEQLVISPQTVKKHTGNIYGKLGVSSRTEAVARARKLDLLD